ncbi:MAG TPA: hypothetical protein EYP32_05765 [Aquificaceae bacterium]|nr:hypothetical protein [Aquificaceae bacterium]
MELRRIEGILLEQAILSKQVEEAYKTAKSLEIKITSRVPEVIQNLLNLPRIKAQVIENKGNRLLLLMENGLELKVENNLNIKVKEGEVLTLTPVKSSPLTFKVIQTEIRKNVSLKLLNGLINSLSLFKKLLHIVLWSSSPSSEQEMWRATRSSCSWRGSCTRPFPSFSPS